MEDRIADSTASSSVASAIESITFALAHYAGAPRGPLEPPNLDLLESSSTSPRSGWLPLCVSAPPAIGAAQVELMAPTYARWGAPCILRLACCAEYGSVDVAMETVLEHTRIYATLRPQINPGDPDLPPQSLKVALVARPALRCVEAYVRVPQAALPDHAILVESAMLADGELLRGAKPLRIPLFEARSIRAPLSLQLPERTIHSIAGVADDGTLFIAKHDPAAVLVFAADGTARKNLSLPTRFRPDLIAMAVDSVAGVVYVAGEGGERIVAIDMLSSEPRWQSTPTFSSCCSIAAMPRSGLVVAANACELCVMSASNGEAVASAEAPGTIVFLAVDEGSATIYATCEAGNVYGFVWDGGRLHFCDRIMGIPGGGECSPLSQLSLPRPGSVSLISWSACSVKQPSACTPFRTAI